MDRDREHRDVDAGVGRPERAMVSLEPSPSRSGAAPLHAHLPGIYAAASQPGRWQAVLQALVGSSDCQAGALLGVPEERGGRCHRSVGMPTELLTLLSPPDGLSAGLRQHPGFSGLLYSFCGQKDDPTLCELAGLVSATVRGDCWVADLGYGAALSLHRASFSEAERSVISEWLPHLRAAVHLAWQLASAHRQNRSLFAMLGGLGYGALLLDSDGAVLEANERGASLLEAGQSLYLHGQELVARCESSHAQLRACMDSVIQGRMARASTQLQDQHGRLEVLCMRYAETPGLLALANPQEPQFVVFVTECDAAANLSIESLAQTFRLSPTEAELMHLLANDYEVGEVAAARGISVNTVRSQLAALREKTGASRQTALVRMALMSPARLASHACQAC